LGNGTQQKCIAIDIADNGKLMKVSTDCQLWQIVLCSYTETQKTIISWMNELMTMQASY